MNADSGKTQTEICIDFQRKKRKVTRFGFVSIPLLLVVFGIFGLGIGPLPRPWILATGIVVLVIVGILGNLDWSCPACGKFFRKTGIGIRFCPFCGVTLIEGAERYRPSGGGETGAEHAGVGKPDPVSS